MLLLLYDSSDPADALGRYVIQTLSELDSNIRHLAKHCINSISFQAQTGELTQGMRLAPIPAHQHSFQPVQPHYNMLPISNQMTNNPQYDMSSQVDYSKFFPNTQASASIWFTTNSQELFTIWTFKYHKMFYMYKFYKPATC